MGVGGGAGDEAVRVHSGAEAGAVLGVAELVREGADDEVCLTAAVLLELLGDRSVVLVDGLRGEGQNKHCIRGVVCVREHDAVLVAGEVRVVPAHDTGDRLAARGP